jgi:hypothetical protein
MGLGADRVPNINPDPRENTRFGSNALLPASTAPA